MNPDSRERDPLINRPFSQKVFDLAELSSKFVRFSESFSLKPTNGLTGSPDKSSTETSFFSTVKNASRSYQVALTVFLYQTLRPRPHEDDCKRKR